MPSKAKLCSLLVTTVASVGASVSVAANDSLLNDQRDVRLFEGDIFLENKPVSRAVAIPESTKLWPDGVVPYKIDPSLPIANVLSITEAIRHWNSVSAITLQEVSGVSASSANASDYVNFVPGEFCASWVGKRGGMQELWVAPNCNVGSIMHEIGHVLGLEHEHTRPDRNNYIQIHWDNIDAQRIHNFDAAPAGSRMLGAYDYASIMHYGSDNFSVNGKPTITIKGGTNHAIGQRVAPSAGDLSGIGELYGADLSVVAQTYPSLSKSDIDVFVTNEVSQGAHDVSLTVSTANGDALSIDDSGAWSCDASVDSNVVCSLARLPAGGSEVLRLVAEVEVENLELHAHVQSKTPDIDVSNNSNSGGAASANLNPLLVPQPVQITEDSIAEDAVAHVSTGGAVSLWWAALILLIRNRQTGRRIDNQAL